MRKPLLAAGAFYLMALPGMVIFILNDAKMPLPIVPVVVTLACIHIGLALGPRVGFRSLILDKISGHRLTGLGSGIAYVTVGVIAAQLVWFIPAHLLVASGHVKAGLIFPHSISIGAVLSPFWIGGVIEEFVYRWAGMSLGVFLLWKWLDRDSEKPAARLYWLALFATSCLFGLSHLLHVCHTGSRIFAPYGIFLVGVTFIGGLIIGWIFWKKGLEFAMATHCICNLLYWLFIFYK